MLVEMGELVKTELSFEELPRVEVELGVSDGQGSGLGRGRWG